MLPGDVFWEGMLLTSAVGAKGRVRRIRLWLLATAGKSGRKANQFSSPCGRFNRIGRGAAGRLPGRANTHGEVSKGILFFLLVFLFVFKGNLLSSFLRGTSARAENTSVEQRAVP